METTLTKEEPLAQVASPLFSKIMDPMIFWGLISIVVSAGVFFLTGQISRPDTGLFFLNYAFTAIYSLAVLFTAWRNRHLYEGDIDYTLIMLVLWFISAFALNREMNVFDEATNWLSVYIIISVIALLLTLFKDSLPNWAKQINFGFLGSALVLFVYYAIFLVKLYPISLPAMLLLGISIHSYIPAFLALLTITVAARTIKIQHQLMFPLVAGFLIPIAFTFWFCNQWEKANVLVNNSINENTLNEGKLPTWAVVAQELPQSWVSERLIKSSLIYKTVNFDSPGSFWGDFDSRRFDEKMQHDPLVLIASLFKGSANLDEGERIKILEAMYNSRHQAERRLWDGRHLSTSNITTNVKIFPEFRLAYTEKILSIKNSYQTPWNAEEEAIYTFHLPEGAVVSSLSLWINGKEEKGYLTTKAKADSAYSEIVGVQRRDPSVVHWQEGNRVSVRVFPCTANENRKFKIGITSPLQKEQEKLIYKNIYFKGPDAENAFESVQIAFSGKAGDFEVPSGYKEVSGNTFLTNQKYDPDWQVSCSAPTLSSENFSFNGKSYYVKDYKPQLENFEPERIYLDLNKSWEKNELLSIWESVKTKEVYVFDKKLTKLSEKNINEIFSRMSQLNFSIFPVYKIHNPGSALVVSKETEISPNFNDLKGSIFAERVSKYLSQSKPIRLFNIGNQLPPYLKTLKELRVFNYTSGSISDIQSLLNKRRFVKQAENDSTVLISSAGITINENPAKTEGKAPDHLLRLFAYNDVMKKVGPNYFNDNFIQPEIINEAQTAYVVSPVSSLIVLETQDDYQRFGIEASKNSLQNASMKSSGAVPEPHEWLMILLSLSLAAYLWHKQKQKETKLIA